MVFCLNSQLGHSDLTIWFWEFVALFVSSDDLVGVISNYYFCCGYFAQLLCSLMIPLVDLLSMVIQLLICSENGWLDIIKMIE